MSATQKLLRFGVFELNLDALELRKSGAVVKLPPQPFKLLGLLASHAGQMVTREEIETQLWGEETHVDFEHGVNKCIKQIRAVLGDDADRPIYIETLPRQGYRFLAPVVSKTVAAPGPRVVESQSGERSRVPALTGGAATLPPPLSGAAAPNYGLAPQVAEPTSAAQPETATATIPVDSTAAPRRRSLQRHLVKIGLAVLVVAVAVGGIFYLRARSRHALTEKDTIVVADFDNKTGDPAFDLALREGLDAQLDQSPFLNLLSPSRISHTLTLMTKPKDARLTEEVAREVCQRTGSAATIEGSISTLGNLYVLGVKAVDCHNGSLLADEQVTAKDKDHVVEALGEAATKLRTQLGESLASVQKYDVPADNVTTSSLEALQAYSLGDLKLWEVDYLAAKAQFQRAVSLDPDFAMAYAKLAASYSDLLQTGPAIENIRKAYDLRDRLSEREKFVIAMDYANLATGNVEETLKNYELWAQTYPRDLTPSTNIGAQYVTLGDYDNALAAFQNGLKLDSGNRMLSANLGYTYLLLDRPDDAKAAVEESKSNHLDSPPNSLTLYAVAFLQHDAAGMERERAAFMGKPGYEDQMLYLDSDTAAYSGQFVKARELTQRAVESARRAQEDESAAADMAEGALREALIGNLTAARQQATAALGLSNGREPAGIAAVALALAGDTERAKRVADDLASRYPENTIVQFNYLPNIVAATALANANPAEALERLKPAAPYELGWVSASTNFNLYPIYVRGEAYLAAHQGTNATAEFQKILDHPGVVQNEPIGALAHLGLGRAYVLSGDTIKAKLAYQDFLTLWKDADPDIPIYKQAKAEYAKVQ